MGDFCQIIQETQMVLWVIFAKLFKKQIFFFYSDFQKMEKEETSCN